MKLYAYECDYCGDAIVIRPDELSLEYHGWQIREQMYSGDVHTCPKCLEKGE